MTTPAGPSDLESSHEQLMSMIPPDQRTSTATIRHAYEIFGERLGVRPDIRFCYNPPEGEQCASMIIVIDQRLSLWFFFKDEKWVFDGYECGPYEDLWRNRNLPDRQRKDGK